MATETVNSSLDDYNCSSNFVRKSKTQKSIREKLFSLIRNEESNKYDKSKIMFLIIGIILSITLIVFTIFFFISFVVSLGIFFGRVLTTSDNFVLFDSFYYYYIYKFDLRFLKFLLNSILKNNMKMKILSMLRGNHHLHCHRHLML
jgi:uncharacterized membrane protein